MSKFGVIARFESPESLVHAAEKVRDKGFTKFDCHSPFPIHGMDDAMGLKRSKLGYLIGAKFGDTKFYRLLRRNRLRKFEKYFRQFGGFLLIVAALTPIPFSGICMLLGSAKYSFQKLK